MTANSTDGSADREASDEQKAPPEPATQKPDKKATSQEPTIGSYVMRGKSGGGPLNHVLFDWDPRWTGFSIPTWQSDLHNAIIKSQGEILSSGLTISRQEFFLFGLNRLYHSSCVVLPATSRKPTSLGDYLKIHEQIMAHFRDELDETAFDLSQDSLKYTAGALGFLAVVGTAGLYVSGSTVAPANYTLAAAASLAGLIVADFLLPSVQTPDEFKRHLRRVRRPFGRILVTCILALFGCLLVSSGTVAIKIGDWVSSDLKKHTELALLIGFLAGVPSSWLARRIIGFLNGRDEPKSTSQGNRTSGASGQSRTQNRGRRTICSKSYAKPPWCRTEAERRVAV